MTGPDVPTAALRRDVGLGLLTLVAASGTLVCCVLPAVMVALGAGAALAGLVSAVPQLVWLSAHKAAVFGLAGGLLALSGLALWQARGRACPADPRLAATCRRLRRAGIALWGIAAVAVTLGATVAFVLPRL